MMTAPKNGPERDVRAPATNKSGRYRETSEFIGFVRRSIRALTKRVGVEGDIEGLMPMLQLQQQLNESIVEAVAGLRAAGYSWGEIGARTGTTRQNAQQRWGKAIDALAAATPAQSSACQDGVDTGTSVAA